ncbi:MAG: sensor histidine kinase [Verrucomicrobia bacterium]|nr:sensor histidine kinase [Verrucomicrobiota bacterium]MBU4290356.1 sensor histidine kinase [Verrucomicrobiota bacterium]MBU4430200.1 sensor histidine kinase [Verrucomicrobiota bacterium]MCG2681486.1 sensor histidine kinase [Kiritimatiellia bacterium]
MDKVLTLAGKMYMAGIFRDITERKQADDLIRASLREKEVLLKEIHHRVKNNLQVISSLLNLQSQYIVHPHDLQLFRESQMRLRTMALIHEKLYQSSDLSQTNFAEYLGQLTEELLRLYKIHDVRIRVDVEAHIRLGIDLAIPCALIVHELVSNSLKHAFAATHPAKSAEDRKAHHEIRVGFRDDPGAGFLLLVGDNGVGLPPHIEMENTKSLGWQLITALTLQIHGRLTINRSHGTEVQIRLPKEN